MSNKKFDAKTAAAASIQENEPLPDSPSTPAAPAEVAVQAKPQDVRKPIYTLFINDEVAAVGTGRVPTGAWYAVYADLEHSEFHGPYPLLVKTNKGTTVLTGYCSVDNLKGIASKMYTDLSRAKWAEKPSPVYLQDDHKMMSAMLWVE